MSREKEEQIHTLFSKLSDRRVDMSECHFMHGRNSPVEDALFTAGKVLVKIPYARREKFCRRYRSSINSVFIGYLR